MKVIAPGGAEIELGVTEATPTIGIRDYSRRVTDDFGVTTVVKRGFARIMSVKLALPTVDADRVQDALVDLRATAARWIADDRFAWLDFEGLYKDFQLDLAVPPLSYCTLTVEGLAETEEVDDAGEDPAPDGSASSLQLLRPVPISGAMLVASNVPETDHPEWSPVTIYASGARVIKAATHRIYESVADSNLGNDPAGLSGVWIDAGPTNRWAMFDEALGTATSRAGDIALTLAAGAVEAVALLDVVGATVRVQTTCYDQTKAVGAGPITFLDLPGDGANIVVTVSGAGTRSVGTLIAGTLAPLGITAAEPTAGITDYSRKEFDDFGEPTIVERAWSKRMGTRALIRTDAIDVVANRIAAERARPGLWIAADGLDCLTIYGFFKEFSIEVGENVSLLTLSVEGLSKAAPLPDIDTSTAPPTDISPIPPAVLPEGTLWIAPDGHPYRFGKQAWTSNSAAWIGADGMPWLGGGYIDVQDQIGPQAQQVAAAIMAQIARIASDNWLTAGEKPTLILTYQALTENYIALDAKAVSLGAAAAERAAAATAMAALSSFLAALTPAWNDTSSDTPIVGATLTALWADAAQKVALLQAAIQGLPGPPGDPGDPGEPGAPGDPGIPALSISSSLPVFNVARTAAGAPKAGELPKTTQIKVYEGDTDVTALCTFAKADTGCSVSNNGGGSFSLTALSAEEAYTVITATYGARSIPIRVAVAQPRDGSAASRASAALSSMTTSGSFVQVGSVDIVAAAGTTISGTGSATYQATNTGAGVRYVRAEAKVSIQNLTDSGAESDGSAVIGSAASYIAGDGPSDIGSVSASKSVTNTAGAPKTFRVRLYMRKYDGLANINTTGGTYSGTVAVEVA